MLRLEGKDFRTDEDKAADEEEKKKKAEEKKEKDEGKEDEEKKEEEPEDYGLFVGRAMSKAERARKLAEKFGPTVKGKGKGKGKGGDSQTVIKNAPPGMQKQMLGEKIFPMISRIHPEMAGKITGMMLEMDNSELLMLVESPDQLKAKVDEALRVSTEKEAADELKLIEVRRREAEIHHE